MTHLHENNKHILDTKENVGHRGEGDFKNPFVKLGDLVKLHSRKVNFRVLEIRESFFIVSGVQYKWFIKKVEIVKCPWEDFRCWSGITA